MWEYGGKTTKWGSKHKMWTIFLLFAPDLV